ncbi:hypothetical protein BC567DRAFT_227891 [Phyllosticta citribraziliensis]
MICVATRGNVEQKNRRRLRRLGLSLPPAGHTWIDCCGSTTTTTPPSPATIIETRSWAASFSSIPLIIIYRHCQSREPDTRVSLRSFLILCFCEDWGRGFSPLFGREYSWDCFLAPPHRIFSRQTALSSGFGWHIWRRRCCAAWGVAAVAPFLLLGVAPSGGDLHLLLLLLLEGELFLPRPPLLHPSTLPSESVIRNPIHWYIEHRHGQAGPND